MNMSKSIMPEKKLALLRRKIVISLLEKSSSGGEVNTDSSSTE